MRPDGFTRLSGKPGGFARVPPVFRRCSPGGICGCGPTDTLVPARKAAGLRRPAGPVGGLVTFSWLRMSGMVYGAFGIPPRAPGISQAGRSQAGGSTLFSGFVTGTGLADAFEGSYPAVPRQLPPGGRDAALHRFHPDRRGQGGIRRRGVRQQGAAARRPGQRLSIRSVSLARSYTWRVSACGVPGGSASSITTQASRRRNSVLRLRQQSQTVFPAQQLCADAATFRRACHNHTGCPPGSWKGPARTRTRTTTAGSLTRTRSRSATLVRSRKSEPIAAPGRGCLVPS